MVYKQKKIMSNKQRSVSTFEKLAVLLIFFNIIHVGLRVLTSYFNVKQTAISSGLTLPPTCEKFTKPMFCPSVVLAWMTVSCLDTVFRVVNWGTHGWERTIIDLYVQAALVRCALAAAFGSQPIVLIRIWTHRRC
jgi:hypothetical protein